MSLRTRPSRRSTVGGQCDCIHHLETGPIAMSTCIRCLGTGVTDPRRELTLKRNREMLIPTQEEIFKFDGAHCKKLYASIGADWRCPGCYRTKYQLMRWTKRFQGSPNAFMGWVVGLHKHHDHGSWPGRFAETLVCEQCNSADATAKRVLGLPRDFSFAPSEIRQFVLGIPHGWHLIQYHVAAALYENWWRSANSLPPLISWPPGAPS
jgi:hypothetical protein